MSDDPSVTDLVTRAKTGDQQAWDALVERYAPLVWAICRRYRLNGTDANEVGQSVWLRLVDHLHNLRDPATLPDWLATTTRRECGRVLPAARQQSLGQKWDARSMPGNQSGVAEHELLMAERNAALREAFQHLPPPCQRLLALLIEDPPVPNAQISAILEMQVDSIGPSRRRCLDKLRHHPAISALTSPDAQPG
jgi:RNA polymerase sigma factor (sigma-70 family)